MQIKRIYKILNQALSVRKLSEYQVFAIAIVSVLIYMFEWTAFIDFMKIDFSLSAILQIHSFVFVWFVDLITFIFIIFGVVAMNYYRYLNLRYTKIILGLKREINSNKVIADMIRKGELNSTDNLPSNTSKSLIGLVKYLESNNKKEQELKWITKGKELIGEVLRDHRDIYEMSIDLLKTIINYSNAAQGAFYVMKSKKVLECSATYAYNRQRFVNQEFAVGKGLVGQAAYEKELIYRTEIPDDYFTITSGLLNYAKPKSLLIIPLLQDNELQGVMELAFMTDCLESYKLSFAKELMSMIGPVIYTQKINARTAYLLSESRSMTETLKENEEKLKQNAEEMMIAQDELRTSNEMLNAKMQEVENGQKRMTALLSNAAEFISMYDENQRLVFESPSVKRILGYNDNEDVVGLDLNLLTPKGYKTIMELFKYLKETPGGESMAQYTYLKKDGRKLFLETRGKNMLHDPAIRGIIFNTRDITERIRAEKEERMKSRMQSLSENSPDMIFRVNTQGKLVYANPAVATIIGKPMGQINKKRVNDLGIDIRFINFVEDSLTTVKESDKQLVKEIEVSFTNGERIMQIKVIPEHNEDNELESVLFVAHDMTEIKRIELEIIEKNKKISDSINYAQRIQTSILPNSDYLSRYFPESFMFYRPKDVVSGDFPWCVENNGNIYIAAVDCTGHGVPGALLSFIGYFLLNNIVNIDDNFNAAKILDLLHQGVRSTLKQNEEGNNGRDGMDLALCKINKETQTIQFAGAHNPLYLLRDGELIEYKGTRKGIGGKPLLKKKEKDFENHEIKYIKGDKIFIFSDGFPDQIGGPKRKKYQSKRIRETLVQNSNLTMRYLESRLNSEFYSWKGAEKQVDDVLLIGIEL